MEHTHQEVESSLVEAWHVDKHNDVVGMAAEEHVSVSIEGETTHNRTVVHEEVQRSRRLWR
jgi:hypothetical protein